MRFFWRVSWKFSLKIWRIEKSGFIFAARNPIRRVSEKNTKDEKLASAFIRSKERSL